MSHIVSAFAAQQLSDLEQLARTLRGPQQRRSHPEPLPASRRSVVARPAPRRRWGWAWRQA